MKTRIKVLLFFSLFIIHNIFGKGIASTEVDNPVKISSVTSVGFTIEVNIDNFDKEAELINEKEFYTISLNHESVIKEKGYPELPKVVRDISILPTTDIKGKMVKCEYKDIELPIIPSKGVLLRKVNPKDVPYTFAKIYSQNEFFPEQRVEFGEPYLMRDIRGASMTIYPFAYNPVKQVLRVYTKLIFEVSFEGVNNKNTASEISDKKNRYFEPVFKNHFINYGIQTVLRNSDNSDTIANVQSNSAAINSVGEEGRMLIITYDNFYNDMLAFAAYKNSIGLPTQVVKISNVGSTASQIYNYIKNNYENDNTLTFVLLAGDHAQVPSMIVNSGGSDPSYSLISGNDDYPDIVVGRFSAETTSQITTMISRSIAYENMVEQSWFHKGIGIASDQGPGDNNEYDYQHLRNIRTELLNYHYTSVDEMYDGSQGGQDAPGAPTAAMVTSSVNNGASIINYTGHGDYDCWVTSNFTNTNANALTNDNKLPFIFSVACQNGNFTGYTCFAETWLRATNNSTGNPTGAVAFYGSSVNQAWNPPMRAQDQFISLLISDLDITFGALCYNASIEMMSVYGQSGVREFKNWNIFGDPSITVIPHKACSVVSVTGLINVDTTYNGCNIEVSNATITNNAHVVFDATKETVIESNFEVQQGSTLEVK